MFSVKQTLADLGLKPYPYEDANGETRELPHLYMLTAEQAKRVAELADSDPLEAIAAIGAADIPLAAAGPMLLDYFAHCGRDDLGKLLASSASLTSIAKPSKPTSRATTTAKTRKR